MSKPGIGAVSVKEISEDGISPKEDLLVMEEPLEIRVGYGQAGERHQKSLAVTMRTPGHDLELALGFLYSEGVLEETGDLLSIKHCEDIGRQEERDNVVRAELSEQLIPDFEKLKRNFFVSSSCGICGKTTIDAVRTVCNPLQSDIVINRVVIYALIKKLESSQPLFGVTGGLHAAGLFDAKGKLLLLREDIGRHNAVDKILGAAFEKKMLPLADNILLLSGRAGFELIQKALRAGIPVVAAVGAPSGLAVSLAKEFDLTLIGFLRNNKFNVYSGESRIQ